MLISMTKNIATERAELILTLGEKGYTASFLQRLTLIKLRLLALQLDYPEIFS